MYDLVYVGYIHNNFGYNGPKNVEPGTIIITAIP